ncbi:mannose-1-phosphate guanyltransferase beta-like protein [Mycotypha africana]|uniref:mannose-1-phosphate guanyltransferase beta-like protein n=1 Tax=Mycotypha africana TaxID=64632 RepID=UPI0023017FDC|nr:mannose-1-phosphate guanyltransferase beta-like protein [Mycotypha africana]KAI8967174.1 mannose-1-phosphate guanyltransferase beta-like protein [Mycotypha africana]
MVKVLILGAGYGTRLQRDLQLSAEYRHLLGVPKALLPLGGRDALITHWLELFEAHGLKAAKDIFVITNEACYDSIKQWATRHSVPLDHIVSDGTTSNENRLGAVPDIMFAVKHFHLLQNDVLVVGGDTLFLHDFSLSDFLDTFEEKNKTSNGRPLCLVTTYEVSDADVHKFGIVGTDEKGAISSFLEKPDPSSTTNRSACPCFYLFHRQALPIIDEFIQQCQKSNAPKEAYDATGKCLAYLFPRFPIQTMPISGRIDVGGLQSYIDANRYFELL